MRKTVFALSMGLALGSLVLWGCSSNPSKEQLQQLDATRAEIASLTQKESALKQEEASLQKAINDNQAKLKTCQDDKSSVELKLKNTN